MARYSWFVPSLLLFLAISSCKADYGAEDDEYADVERAHLVVRKYVLDPVVVQERNITVNIEIYNGGVSSAIDVELKDSLPEGFKLIDGSLETKFPKVLVGTTKKISYVIVATRDQTVQLPSAIVTYQAEADSVQTGFSSSPTLYVITTAQEIQRTLLYAGRWMTLGLAKSPSDWRNLAIFLVGCSSLFGINWAIKSVSSASVTRKRDKALKELEKTD